MKFYTAEELAEMFHQKQETIRRKIVLGEFGAIVRVGRKKLVTQEGLDAYITAHTGPAADQPAEVAWRGKTRKSGADIYAKL